jgi:spoIIIJ-associated protein
MSGAAPAAARETLENMLGHLGFAFTLEEEKRGEDQVLHVRMQNPARLIGREGEVLDDLQFLLNRPRG